MQRLKDNNVLDTFRRVEARLDRLHEDSRASLSIMDWAGYHGESSLLWLNFPGKESDDPNSWCAIPTHFGSLVVFPSCKYDSMYYYKGY